jgi:hypothetical protein
MAAITVTKLVPGTKPLPASRPKTGLRGAAGGIYVGPVVAESAIAGPTDATHAVTSEGGGVEDTTSYRESDSYVRDGGTGRITGAITTVSNTRPTARTQSLADGIQGGSVPGDPAASADNRSSIDGEGGAVLGTAGRGTSVAAETVTVGTSTTRPGLGSVGSGTIGLVDGTAGVFSVDLDAADISGGGNSRAGALIAVWSRDTDTDEDNDLLFLGTIDGGTDVTALFTPGAGTYAVYAAWRYLLGDGRSYGYGPLSARATLAVT